MTEKVHLPLCSADQKLWKGSYGTEPFDLRLTVLRLIYKIPVIVAATLLGTLILGGGYYVKNVLLRSQFSYEATSVYRIEYAAEDVEDMLRSYINEMSWNTYVQSRMFLELVQARLAGEAEMSGQELGDSLEAFLWSDVRVPAIRVTTEDPGKTEAVIRAVDAVMTQDFSLPEISSMAVIDPGQAEEVIPNVRVKRAVIFSALLSCFFTVAVLLFLETWNDCIWLPGSVWKRYGLKTAGTLESRELASHMQYFFRENGRRKGAMSNGENGRESKAVYASQENRRIAVCAVQEEVKTEAVLEKLKERCPETVDSDWFAVSSPLTNQEVCALLREADGILLAVKAGYRAGKKLEYVLEYLEQQDCEVTAAILWEADEKLIRRYYFMRTGKNIY